MRVALNARVLSTSSLRGWNRYTINLICGLAKLGTELFLYTDREIDPEQLEQLPREQIHLRQSPPMNYLSWEQLWIPRQCRRDGIDVFHSPIHFGLPQRRSVKCLLTLHDAIDQAYYSAGEKRQTVSQRVTDFLCRMARFRADHIVTVSDFSKRDLARIYKLPASRISVSYEAADDRFHRPVSQAQCAEITVKYSLQKPYLFYLGSLERRKNIPFLLKALAMSGLSDLHLALGGENGQAQGELLQLAAELGIADRVQLLGRLPDADLPALYAAAEAFVYPSEYEGFGLQICEALAVGCPVFVADATCLPEILGDGGETFPLSDAAPLARLLRRLHSEPQFRDDLKERALRRAQAFSWERTARETLRVYEALCAKAPELSPAILPAVAVPIRSE